MEKGVFSEWLKHEGEFVNQGDAVFSIEADKAVEEVLSEDAGTLSILAGVALPGTELLVGTVIGFLLEAGEAPPVTAPATPRPATLPAQTIPVSKQAPDPKASQAAEARQTGVVASPRARRVSRELSVDWRRLTPTGTGGRVRERDVLRSATLGGVGRNRGSGLVSLLRVRADATQLVALLDRLADSAYVSSVSDHYEAILVKLAARAYLRNTSGVAASCLAVGMISSEGLGYRSLRGAETHSVSELAALSQGPVGLEDTLSGDEAFTSLSLDSLGLDEYLPEYDVPGGQLLLFGRLARSSTRGEGASIALALSFQEAEVSLSRAAKFLEDVRIAVEDPFVFLA